MNRRTVLARLSAGLAALGSAGLFPVSARSDNVIRIGAVAPKTGPLASGALVSHWPNIELWVREVNDRGGLRLQNGRRKIEVIEYDDRTDPGEHIKAAQRLATEDKVDFIVAPYGTGLNVAAAPIYAKYGYPQIAVTAITDQVEKLTARYRTLFFTLGSTTAFVKGVRDVLVKLRAKEDIGDRVAMVGVADAFGIELADVARPLFTEAGFKLVYDKSYPFGSFDLSPLVKDAAATGPDCFIAWSYPPDTFGLTEHAIAEDLDVKVFYTAVGTSFQAYVARFGSRIDNVIGAGATNPDDPKIAQYRKRHEDVTGKKPDYWASANTYVSLQILEQAIEGVGELDRAKVTAYIKQHVFETIMGEIRFENQISEKYWTVGQWQDGVFCGIESVNVDGSVPFRLKDGWT